MFVFQYPVCHGSWQRNAKFRFAEPPPCWVGSIPRRRPTMSLGQRLAAGARLLSESPSNFHLRFKLGAGGARAVVTGTKAMVTGGDVSRISGRPQEYESLHEQAFFKLMEVDPGVEDYGAQPAEFFNPNEVGQRGAYFPDVIRRLADDRVQVIEVKKSLMDIREEEYAEKLALVADDCRKIGWEFHIVEGFRLREANVFNISANEIEKRKFTVTPVAIRARAKVAVERKGGRVALGELIELLGGWPVGLDIVCSLICQREFVADLRYPWTLSTSITSAREARA